MRPSEVGGYFTSLTGCVEVANQLGLLATSVSGKVCSRLVFVT